MIKNNIAKQKEDSRIIGSKLLLAMRLKNMDKIPFIIYHLIKQCPDGLVSKQIRKRDYSYVYTYFRISKAKWGNNQIEKCIKKLDELIL